MIIKSKQTNMGGKIHGLKGDRVIRNQGYNVLELNKKINDYEMEKL